MKIIKTKLKNLVILKSKVYKDHRGFFKEVEKNKILKKKFIFDCFSYSKKNTLRGLHLQTNKSQAKIITVVQGKILDVVVDLRKNSKTYGKFHKNLIFLSISLRTLHMVSYVYQKTALSTINVQIIEISQVRQL